MYTLQKAYFTKDILYKNNVDKSRFTKRYLDKTGLAHPILYTIDLLVRDLLDESIALVAKITYLN